MPTSTSTTHVPPPPHVMPSDPTPSPAPAAAPSPDVIAEHPLVQRAVEIFSRRTSRAGAEGAGGRAAEGS